MRSNKNRKSTGTSSRPKPSDGSSTDLLFGTKGAKLTLHVEIGATGADEDGRRFSRVRIMQSGLCCLVRHDDLATARSEAFDQLNRSGAHLVSPQARREFVDRIQLEASQKPSFPVITRIGWHTAPDAFILPGKVIAAQTVDPECLFEDGRPERLTRYRTGGTLADWKELPRLAIGNSRLMAALALGFVGPIGPILGVEQPGLQLVGDAALGKSTVLRAVGSIWGRHTDPNMANGVGFGMSWNATLFDIEAEANAANHTLLVLDETRSATTNLQRLAEIITEAITRWDGSVQRGSKNVVYRHTWWTPLLSASNLSLCEMGAKANAVIVDEAFIGRLIEIPLPNKDLGIFERLHGEPDVPTLAKRIIQVASEHFGHASRRFIHRLVQWRQRDAATLKQWLEKRRSDYIRKASAIDGGDRQLDRVHGKMATIYAAGRLAIKFGIVPWKKKQLRTALLRCTRDHIAHIARGTKKITETQRMPMQRLCDHLRQHRGSFIDATLGKAVGVSREELNGCEGYIFRSKTGVLEYLFSEQKFNEIVGNAADVKTLKHELDELKGIAKTQGTRWPRFSVKRPIDVNANGKPRRVDVIAIRASVLDATLGTNAST